VALAKAQARSLREVRGLDCPLRGDRMGEQRRPEVVRAESCSIVCAYFPHFTVFGRCTAILQGSGHCFGHEQSMHKREVDESPTLLDQGRNFH